MKRFFLTVALVALSSSLGRTDSFTTSKSIETWIQEAEQTFYSFHLPGRLTKVDAILYNMRLEEPNHPYAHWAKARVAFFRKEAYYLLEQRNKRGAFDREKLALAELCHENADRCIELAPQNAECHLLKGACYATQASTWGVSFKSLRVASPMNNEWKKAMTYPSSFPHMAGQATTKQLAQIFRGILHRLTPESWWFWLLAGMKGNREKAYHWLDEAIVGSLQQDPMLLLEYAAAALCHGKKDNKPMIFQKGLDALQRGTKLKIRYPMDGFDKMNIEYLLDHPDQACNYRRERFEDVHAATQKIHSK